MESASPLGAPRHPSASTRTKHTTTGYRTALAAPSPVEDREVEPAEAVRVGEHVDLDDLPARDREAHDGYRPSVPSRHEPRGPVHERRPRKRGQPREGKRPPGNRPRATDQARRPRGPVVGPEHDVLVEHR